VAGEADTPFFACSGADFIEIYGGSGPKRVRELFNEARQNSPCVVFIDEIDAIGSRNSGRSMGGGSSEENRTINQLLSELDGLSSKEPIVVVAATNYPDAIDKALLREGRFDRKVNIPMPDREARVELFHFYLNRIITGDPNCKPKIMKFKKPSEQNTEENAKKSEPQTANPAVVQVEETHPVKVVPGVDNKRYAEILADRTPGVSPAQIATIVNEAALTAAVSNHDVVALKELQDGIDDVLIGKKHRQRMSDASLRRTAFHECGHAIMAWVSPLQKDVIKISIIPRGRAGGYTQQVQDEAMEPQTDQFLFSQLCVLLGGRVAERVVMGDISTGALDDLQRATKIAMDKLLTYGMSKKIGQMAFKPNQRNDGRAWMNFSEDLHAEVEAEARELVNKAYSHTEATLRSKEAELKKLADLLLEKKEVMREDIIKVLGERVNA
jgi:AFG3 family protein